MRVMLYLHHEGCNKKKIALSSFPYANLLVFDPFTTYTHSPIAVCYFTIIKKKFKSQIYINVWISKSNKYLKYHRFIGLYQFQHACVFALFASMYYYFCMLDCPGL